jgi:hypothetical protein
MGLLAAFVALLSLLLAGCIIEETLGACEGHAKHEVFCYDDFTREECEQYDLDGHLDAYWEYHPGLFCDEL